jgi:MFS family permease
MRTRRAVAGALALAAAMGIGRFAYTALLPPTQRALGFDDRAAGAIASVNLLGYLAGALIARSLGPARRGAGLRAGIAGTSIATALLVVVTGEGGWGALRAVSGVASGLVFVLASAAALDLTDDSGAPRPGLLYAGVGAGIALSGVVAALYAGGDWRLPWLVLAGAAALLGVPAWSVLAGPPRRAVEVSAAEVAPGKRGDGAERGLTRAAAAARVANAEAAAAAAEPAPPSIPLGRLATAYTLEGLGYIVSGTFAVVAVQRTPGLEHLAPWTWTLAGLAAVPSALAWTWLARHVGLRASLATAFTVQALALPSLSASAGAAAAGAVFFGGTFIGITALTMTAAREIAPGAVARLIASLTVLYGIGQAIGPAAAGVISRRAGDPRPAVLAASLAVAIGGAIVWWPSSRR